MDSSYDDDKKGKLLELSESIHGDSVPYSSACIPCMFGDNSTRTSCDKRWTCSLHLDVDCENPGYIL